MSARPINDSTGRDMTMADQERALGTLDEGTSARRDAIEAFLNDPRQYMEDIRSGARQPVSGLGRVFAFFAAIGNMDEELGVPEVEREAPRQERPATQEEIEAVEAAAEASASITDILERMQNGTATQQDIMAFELAGEEIIRGGMASGSIGQREGQAALRVINPDGVISNQDTGTGIRTVFGEVERSEYDIYQSILDTAVERGALNASDLRLPNGSSFDGHIDNTVELGVVMAALEQQRSEAQENSR